MKKEVTFAIWNLKGGTGKTTTTINLAYDLAETGRKVLVIDFDPQVNTTPIFTRANELGYTVLDVLENPETITKAIYRTRYKGIDIVKGSARLGEGYGMDVLDRAVKLVKGRYDTILIDCQPSCGSLTRNALYAADVILTPVVLDRFCLDNLHTVDDILSCMEEEREAKWMVFANKVRGIRSQKKIYEDIMGKCNYPFLETCVSYRAAVPNSLALRKPMGRHAKHNTATMDFKALSEEVQEVL